MAQTKEGALKLVAKGLGLSVAEYQAMAAKGLKRCRICKTWKSLDSFNSDGSRHDGRYPACRLCLNGPGTKRDKLKKAWNARRLTFVPPMKGKKMSVESRRKMSEAAKGRRSNRIGKKHSPETRLKISRVVRERAYRGKQCHSYKDGNAAKRRGQRFSPEYKRWRFDVFARDRFTCQRCGDARGGNLVAHHIKAFANDPQLRCDVANGITLCRNCHDHVHRKLRGDIGNEERGNEEQGREPLF